jgi:UDP-glucose 4-epimerase
MKILVTGGAGFIPHFHTQFYECGIETSLIHRILFPVLEVYP